MAAFEHNLTRIQAHLPQSQKLMAVIKADAYGHGAAMLAPVCQSMGIEMIGVASVDEALQIREVAPLMPVLVMGPTPAWAIADALAAEITLAVFSQEQLGWIQSVTQADAQFRDKPARIHVKVDTGMHRIGIDPDRLGAIIAAVDADDTDGEDAPKAKGKGKKAADAES